jgi:hypothetical protein
MIDIKFGNLFPWTFRFLAAIGLVCSIGIFQLTILGSIILFLASFTVLVSSEGTEFNLTNGTMREYTSYLFFKTGSFKLFAQPEKIFITKGKESEQMHTAHTNHSATFENIVYNGYLKFSTGEKIHLLRKNNKDQLIKKLSPLSDGLKIDIVDHS